MASPESQRSQSGLSAPNTPSEPRGPGHDGGKGRRKYKEGRLVRRSKQLFLIFLALAVVGLGCFLGARPIYQVIKTWRAHSVANQIDVLMKGTNLLAVSRKIRVAISLAPRDPRVVRQAATFLTRVQSPEALTYWEILIALKKATREDKLTYITLCLDLSRLEAAQNVLKQMLAENQRDAEVLELSVRLLQRKGDLERASVAARAALAMFPLDESFQFLAGSMLSITSTNQLEREQGRRLLWGLAVGDGPRHEVALRMLVSNQELTQGENEVLIRTLLSRKNVTTTDRLLAATLRIKIHPDQRETIVNQTLSQVSGSLTDQERVTLGSWLLESGAPEQVLEAIPESVAGTNSPLVSLRFEALAALGRWSTLRAVLDGPTPHANPVLVECLRGMAANAEGLSQRVVPHFEEAARLARTNPVDFLVVARNAERAGLTNAAIDAWRQLMSIPTIVFEAAREIIRLVENQDDLRIARDTLGRVAQFVPNDPTVVSRLAYLDLILNENVAAQREAIKRVSAASPTNTVYRLTHALAEYRANNPSGALSLLEQDGVNWNSAEPRWRALYIAVLAANEQREAARQLGRQLKIEELKAPERELVRGLL